MSPETPKPAASVNICMLGSISHCAMWFFFNSGVTFIVNELEIARILFEAAYELWGYKSVCQTSFANLTPVTLRHVLHH